MTVASPIIVALDYSQPDQALAMADRLDPAKVRVKVGKELFTRGGPDVVRALHDKGFQVFLDLKFHDIPNTLARAVKAAGFDWNSEKAHSAVYDTERTADLFCTIINQWNDFSIKQQEPVPSIKATEGI